jgi:hypothetical protein
MQDTRFFTMPFLETDNMGANEFFNTKTGLEMKRLAFGAE